ncbi:MAG: hypothetical protein IPM26_08085 [Saprospiraceae bacterium]|nr:hypothetical protein [Saprospiraceae bacterium]
MRTFTIILLSIICFQSCKYSSASTDAITAIPAIQEEADLSNDTLAMIHTVKSFLHWYKDNYSRANSFGFTYQDKQGNYHVAMGECEAYLAYLKSSSYISDTYTALWKQYFMDKAAYLEENLSPEGPPEGFEFDLVLITQEPELVLKAIDQKQFSVTENNGTKAVLQMGGEEGYDFDMEKVNGKWMIAYIATMNYD